MIEQPQVLTGMAAVPVVVALVEATGAALAVPRRWYPLLAIAHGVAWNIIAASILEAPALPAALGGVIVGLAASGLYSAAVKPVVRARDVP